MMILEPLYIYLNQQVDLRFFQIWVVTGVLQALLADVRT